MNMRTNIGANIRAAAIALIVLVPAPALAEEALFAGATTLGDEALSTTTGREDVLQFAQSEQNSTVSRNSVSGNSVTGDVTVDDNAFQNISGLSIINANTGNNVSMNATMQVNISITTVP